MIRGYKASQSHAYSNDIDLFNNDNDLVFGQASTQVSKFTNYQEDIYLGYRYWETLFATGKLNETTYGEHVQFPFGFGLSYTNFEWSDIRWELPGNANGEIKVSVKVTNKGTVKGKDVVELCYAAKHAATNHFDDSLRDLTYNHLESAARETLSQPQGVGDTFMASEETIQELSNTEPHVTVERLNESNQMQQAAFNSCKHILYMTSRGPLSDVSLGFSWWRGVWIGVNIALSLGIVACAAVLIIDLIKGKKGDKPEAAEEPKTQN